MSRRLGRLTRAHCSYTGEPYQAGQQTLRTTSSGGWSIPEAHGAQALLESYLMKEVARGDFWWAHPVGIAYTRIDTSSRVGTRPALVVHLDSHTQVDSLHSMSSYVLGGLLPYVAPSQEEVHGVPFLRVLSLDGRDLHVGLTGTDSHVIVRAVPGTSWRSELTERKRAYIADGYVPLWDKLEATAAEVEDRRLFRLTREHQDRAAWLGSGLLRRIGLFHNSSSAYSTRSWLRQEAWVVELETRRDVPLDHDTLLTRLTDPIRGLPVHIRNAHCMCDLSDYPARYIRECRYKLAGIAGRDHVLEIRFRHVPPSHAADVRGKLADLGADGKWLDRVLPEDTDTGQRRTAS